MTDKTNRFSVVFSSGVSLTATILFCLTTLIALRNCFIFLEFGILGKIFMMIILIATIPAVMISIGLILSYVSGRKNEVSPGGIMCMKIGVLIISICSFIGGLLFCIGTFIALFAFQSFLEELDKYSYTNGGEAMIIQIILFFILMIALVFTIVSLMYGIKLFSLLGRMRWYENKKEDLKTGFLKVITIILAVVNGIGLFVHIVLSTVSRTAMNYLYYFLDEAVGLDGYLPRISMSNSLLSNLSGLCTVTFLILLAVMLGKVQYVFRMSGREVMDNQSLMEKNVNTDFDVNEAETFMVAGNSQTDRLHRNAGESGKITSMSGRDAGCCYEIKDGEEKVIGLSPSVSHIVVDSSCYAVSRKHCAVKYIADTDEYFVIDYSTNGTFLNGGAKLNKNLYVAVPSGTVIKLGNDEVAYRLG